MTTLRRLLMSAVLAARPVLPLAASLAVAASCSGGTKKKVAAPDRKQTKSSAELIAAAEAAAKAGDIDGADAKFRDAEKLELALPTVTAHVKMLLANDRGQAAAEVAKTYYETNPSDTGGSVLYANALIGAKEYAKAIEVASEAIELAGNDPHGYQARGDALVASGKPDDALEDLRKATELDPEDGHLKVSYGIALEKAGNVGEAALQFRSAIEKLHEDFTAFLHLGVLRRAQDDNEEAVSWLSKATKADPNRAEAWYYLAIAQNDLSDNTEAETSAQKAATLAQDNGQYWYVYGEILRINKKPDEAKDAYDKALAAPQPFLRAAEKLAQTLVDAGRLEEAEVLLTNNLTASPNNPGLLFQLGFVYGAEKKYRLGIETFEQYLTVAAKDDPNRAKATAEIKALKKRVR